jgi:hypothetical protein
LLIFIKKNNERNDVVLKPTIHYLQPPPDSNKNGRSNATFQAFLLSHTFTEQEKKDVTLVLPLHPNVSKKAVHGKP